MLLRRIYIARYSHPYLNRLRYRLPLRGRRRQLFHIGPGTQWHMALQCLDAKIHSWKWLYWVPKESYPSRKGLTCPHQGSKQMAPSHPASQRIYHRWQYVWLFVHLYSVWREKGGQMKNKPRITLRMFIPLCMRPVAGRSSFKWIEQEEQRLLWTTWKMWSPVSVLLMFCRTSLLLVSIMLISRAGKCF